MTAAIMLAPPAPPPPPRLPPSPSPQPPVWAILLAATTPELVTPSTPGGVLLARSVPLATRELPKTLQAKTLELHRRAEQLENDAIEAQARLGRLIKLAQDRSRGPGSSETLFLREFLRRAQEEALRIVSDGERRTQELRAAGVHGPTVPALCQQLVEHFGLHEQLVELITQMVLGEGP